MGVSRKMVRAASGRVSVVESEGTGPTVLFIHGNSFSSNLFQDQLNGEFGEKCHAVAIDLPGHGQSENSTNPERDYSLPGYASVVEDVVDQLNLAPFVLVGSSLGGHVALELLGRENSNLAGVVTVAAPPIGHDPADMAKAFIPTKILDCAFKGTLSSEEVETYVQLSTGLPDSEIPGTFIADVKRTDERARPMLGDSVQRGEFLDEVKIVSESPVPLLMMGGENDPGINWGYVRGLEYANLFKGSVQVVQNTGHLMLEDGGKAFEGLLVDFINEVS